MATSSTSDEELGSSDGESEKSLEKVDWASESQSRKTTEDSDVWHSESEANWTLAGASLRNGRDIAQSQVLSEGPEFCGSETTAHRRPSVTFNDPLSASKVQKETMLPFSEQEEDGVMVQEELPTRDVSSKSLEKVAVESQRLSAVSPDDPPPSFHEYGFLPARSVQVFGSCSWNLLPLAVNSSLVKPKGHSDSGECIGHKYKTKFD